MTFNVEVKTDDEPHKVGDLVYHKRKLLRVERVTKPRGPEQMIRVKFRVIGKVNLDRQLRSDRGFL